MLSFEQAGRGPAVILIHAGIADRRMWDHQFAALAATHRVIRYDWRGYGRSGDPEQEPCHHEDLLALMDELGLERAALVGCSMGGAYAVEAALAAPARVSALALVASGLAGHIWPQEMLAQARERVHSAVPAERLARYREGGADVEEGDALAMARAQVLWQVAGPERGRGDLSEQVWQRAVTMCEGVFERLWRGPAVAERLLDPPAAGRLGEVRAPTLVINGLADVPGIQQVSDLLSSCIGGARRVDLPDTGHLPPLERPEQVTALLTGFLSPLLSRRAG
ncbi:alpha/beta fold hydrolase [Nonomuraea sp. NPDC049152]|uniref:alpha/beta fold hydrolase n=1 Tax=Nonomuraea sp. NPDC049152 TaxID=3154350 RepID=UPI0033DE126C